MYEAIPGVGFKDLSFLPLIKYCPKNPIESCFTQASGYPSPQLCACNIMCQVPKYILCQVKLCSTQTSGHPSLQLCLAYLHPGNCCCGEISHLDIQTHPTALLSASNQCFPSSIGSWCLYQVGDPSSVPSHMPLYQTCLPYSSNFITAASSSLNFTSRASTSTTSLSTNPSTPATLEVKEELLSTVHLEPSLHLRALCYALFLLHILPFTGLSNTHNKNKNNKSKI